MLYSVRGKLIAIESNAAVVECGGVGYMCQTTMNTLKAVKLNTEVTLYTYLNVREDAVDLFGFATKAELETFKNLISVSGVGPKAGLAVLSELSPEQVAMAIASDDLKTITRAQGIGKKLHRELFLNSRTSLQKRLKRTVPLHRRHRTALMFQREMFRKQSRHSEFWAILLRMFRPYSQHSTAPCLLNSLFRSH